MSTQPCHSRIREKKDSFYSQQVQATIKNQAKRNCEILEYKSVKKFNTSNKSESESSIKSKRKISQIKQTPTKDSPFNSCEKDSYVSNTLKDGSVYGVMLPLILDGNHKQFNQPILVRFKLEILKNFGFHLPFKSFMSAKENFFLMKFKGINFTAQIIAIGANPLAVKKCLNDNMKLNPRWRNLNKMISYGNSVFELTHKPLTSEYDFPSQIVLKDSLLSEIFNDHESLSPENSKEKFKKKAGESSSQRVESNSDESLMQKIEENDTESCNKQRFKSKSELNKFQTKQMARKIRIDSTQIEQQLEEIETVVDEMKSKSHFLSEKDTTGTLLLKIVESIEKISDYLQEKNQNFIDKANTVPEKDKTYKIVEKNQIFLEGNIQVNLDAYESATRNAKPGNPSSFAYQLVHFCFPKVYYENVALGKKFIEDSEIMKLLELKQNGKKVKLPLHYVWGFEDPVNKSFQGEFNSKLGQERIRSFINHIFRKSDIMRYSDEMEKKVRERIIKELCSLNNKKKVNENSPSDSSNESDSQVEYGPIKKEIQEKDKEKPDNDESDQEVENTWNINCFK